MNVAMTNALMKAKQDLKDHGFDINPETRYFVDGMEIEFCDLNEKKGYVLSLRPIKKEVLEEKPLVKNGV